MVKKTLGIVVLVLLSVWSIVKCRQMVLDSHADDNVMPVENVCPYTIMIDGERYYTYMKEVKNVVYDDVEILGCVDKEAVNITGFPKENGQTNFYGPEECSDYGIYQGQMILYLDCEEKWVLLELPTS